jgi:hypothetical protein
MAAAGAMVIGGLGPWASALNVISVNGTRGDGWIVIAAALVGVACLSGYVSRSWRGLGLIAAVCGIAGAVTSAVDLQNIASAHSVTLFGRHLHLVQPGWGIYLDLLASVVFFGLAVSLLIGSKRNGIPRLPAKTIIAAQGAPPTGTKRDVSPRPAGPSTGLPPSAAIAEPNVQSSSDRGLLIGLAIAAGLILVVFGVALYIGGVFGSTTPSEHLVALQPAAAPLPPTTPAVTTPTPAPLTTPSPSASPSPVRQASPQDGPAGTIRSHLRDLSSGDYQAAFGLMTSVYRAQNPSWPSTRSAADPALRIISVGSPHFDAGRAQVPVEFYARDRYATQGSDTQCRDFLGTASLVKEAGVWRYDPGTSSLTATVVAPSDPKCPS